MANDKDIRFGLGILTDIIGGIATASGTGSWEQGVLKTTSSLDGRLSGYFDGGTNAPSGSQNNDPASQQPGVGQSVPKTNFLFYGAIIGGIALVGFIVAKIFKLI